MRDNKQEIASRFSLGGSHSRGGETLNWGEITEGIPAKVMEVRPNQGILVLQTSEDIPPETLEALRQALHAHDISLLSLVLPASADVRLLGDNVVDRIARRVHDAWRADKQAEGYADHPFYPQLSPPPRYGEPPGLISCCSQPALWHLTEMRAFGDLLPETQETHRRTVRRVLTALIAEDTP